MVSIVLSLVTIGLELMMLRDFRARFVAMRMPKSCLFASFGFSISLMTFAGLAISLHAPLAQANEPACARALTPEDALEDSTNTPDASKKETTSKANQDLFKVFVSRHGAEAEKLVSELLDSGVLLGQIHIAALKQALVDTGYSQSLPKAGDPAIKSLIKLRKREDSGDAKFKIAESTLHNLIQVVHAENAFLDPIKRETSLGEAAKTMSASIKDVVKSHELLLKIASSEEKRAFVIALLQEANPHAARMISAGGDGRSAARFFNMLFGTFASGLGTIGVLSTGGVDPTAITVALSGYGMLTEGATNFKLTSGAMIRRAVVVRRLKKMVKETHGEAVAEGLTALPAEAQETMIAGESHRRDEDFHRWKFTEPAAELDLSSLVAVMTYGQDVIRVVPVLADRQITLIERHKLIMGQLVELQKSMSAAQDRASYAPQLKKAFELREDEIKALVIEAAEFNSDLKLVTDYLRSHSFELDSKANEVLARDNSIQFSFNQVRAELDATKDVLSTITQTSVSLVDQLNAALGTMRQNRVKLVGALATKAANGAGR